ncbi:hypothetical protein EGW08_014263 [Elysia chlorotica]|uniref:SMB domain-containing protein n=1 Tax=Elysia chlorotica TaxID=188477 RepID=A0A3S1BY60_ELYCH|nr:hypothetical protein EGW08_014263 [Elysia chlorotica]
MKPIHLVTVTIFGIVHVSLALKDQATIQRTDTGLRDDTRDIRSVFTETSPLDTTFTTPTPASITLKTVAPSASGCPHTPTKFAYEKNLCAGARDPESYVRLGRSRYSCQGRCGQAPRYDQVFSDCACDANCAAHKDCCRDMAQFCPQIQLLSVQSDWYTYNLVFKEHRICSDYAIVHRHGDFEEALPKSPNSYFDAVFTSGLQETLPFKPRNVLQLGNSFLLYQVVEVSSKLIFDDYATYMLARSKNVSFNSDIYFIPRVIEFFCHNISQETASARSVFSTLPWCRAVKSEVAKTVYHRPCKRNQFLSCHCEDGGLITDHVHNACLGQSPQRNSLRYRLWSSHVVQLNDPNPEETCLRQDVSNVGVIPLRSQISQTVEAPEAIAIQKLNNDITMRISPVFSKSTLPQTPTYVRPESTGSELLEPQESFYVDASLNIHFVVELSGTLERRLHCPNTLSRLEDCWLVDCATGGILWTGHPSAVRSCIKPLRARVYHGDGSHSLPFCSCLSMLATLNDLKIWKIKLDPRQPAECSLLLETIATRTRPLDETYDFTDLRSDLKVDPLSTALTDRSIQYKLDREFPKIDQLCPEDDVLGLHVCFFPRASVRDDQTKGEHCLSLGVVSGTGLPAPVSFFAMSIIYLVGTIVLTFGV